MGVIQVVDERGACHAIEAVEGWRGRAMVEGY